MCMRERSLGSWVELLLVRSPRIYLQALSNTSLRIDYAPGCEQDSKYI